MADPRFYDNRGPFSPAQICAHLGIETSVAGAAAELIHDVAGLSEAGPLHLTFFEGPRARDDFARTKAGWCLVSQKVEPRDGKPVLLHCPSVLHAFAGVAALFYPDHDLGIEAQEQPIHPSARIADGVVLAPGVVIGPNVEIGARTRLGPGCVIGRGVTIGAGCEIGAHTSIAFAHIGDGVLLLPGVRIGAPGFGFASDKRGHTHIPQLGRVILQDRVEIGANSAVDRGALGDTVIGEGTKIDNLVQIGHNAVIGRHCILAGKAGVAGSARLGDFVLVGGFSGIGDHAVVGDGARIAGMSGVWGELEGGKDYGGMKARPVREWKREMAALARLGKESKRTKDE
jgi:UDP-3-O-[3-hydroxymyristoyl] glucosamine N-acyltransferase